MDEQQDVTRKHRFATVLIVGGSTELLRWVGAAAVAIGAVVRPVSPDGAIAAAVQHQALAIVLGSGLPRATSEALRVRAARLGTALVDLGEEDPDDDVHLETCLRAATTQKRALPIHA